MGTADTPKLCGACGAMHPSTAPCTTTSGLTGYPAQPQPRGEGDAGKTRGYTREDIQANTWWPGKRGEGDDLAARLDGDRLQEWFTEIQASASLLPEDLQIIASMIARASTHPEQSARVDQRMLASQMETNLRMNRWREHLGDDPLDGFGGRGPAEYHYMATHEPEGPGLMRFGNRGFRPAPPRGEGDDLAARLEAEVEYWEPRRLKRILREAAERIRASTHPEQSARALDPQLADALEALSGDWDGYPECARTNAQAVVDAYRNAASPTTPGRPEAVEEDAEVRMSGEGDDLAARLEARADNADKMAAEVARNPSNYGESGPRHHARLLAAAYAFRKAAEMARASTHPEQWVSGDDREWLLWITSYVLNRHEFTDSAATDARAALTRIATAIKQPASPTPTEQGEDRTRVEWHDGIEHGDELALRQLVADIGCGIPYGCQPSVGKWYAAALDRVLDRLLPLDPAPEQGEARFAADPAPPRGEGGDLAARTVQIIRNRAKIAREQGTTEAQIIRARALDEAANEFADILPALRASTHPEQGETRAFERGVREACRLMRHVDTLDKVPGARDGLPHLNPLWDGSAYVEDALVGPFADRIQRPAPEGEGEAS